MIAGVSSAGSAAGGPRKRPEQNWRLRRLATADRETAYNRAMSPVPPRLSSEATNPPSRFLREDQAVERFGRSMVEGMKLALLRVDPAADAAIEALSAFSHGESHRMLAQAVKDPHRGLPESLVELVKGARRFPAWADDERLRRAGDLLFRAAMPGGIVLGAKSLLSGYTSPAGNKPLIWSGGLRSNVSWRLAETARFVEAVVEPGGIFPGQPGFEIALKVRLMHAKVRQLILQRDDWRSQDWGLPINQHDMVATILLFSNAWLDGVETLGIHTTEQEAEDYVHLWRVVGHVLGVDHDLLFATRAEGQRVSDFLHLTQAPPDDDSRSLVRAFLQHPVDNEPDEKARRGVERRMQAYAGFVRGLLGEETADQLGLPKDHWRFAVPAAREVVRRLERVRRTVPGGKKQAIELGRRHWSRVVKLGLQGMTPQFGLPERLARA